MTPEQFCYWLQGYAELSPQEPPTAEQWAMVVDHLATVFKKETLSFEQIKSDIVKWPKEEDNPWGFIPPKPFTVPFDPNSPYQPVITC